jgi:hypothetical protein
MAVGHRSAGGTPGASASNLGGGCGRRALCTGRGRGLACLPGGRQGQNVRHETTERGIPCEAKGQGGVFTAAQAVAGGLTARQVRRRVDSGRWCRVVGRGITAGDPREPLALAWAAHLTWPDAVVAGRVAAALHQYPVAAGTPVEVLVPRPRHPFRGLVPHHVPYLPGDVARFPGGLPVTSPARTAVDCLSTLDLNEAWSLLSWLITRRRLTRAQLTAHLARRTARPGTAQLRTLHASTAAGAASPPERRLHQLLRRAGIVGWVSGAPVHDGHGLIGLADVLFAEARVIVEIDGYAVHSGRAAFVADRRRQNRLVAAGYVVLRFTWWDLVDRPDDVIGTVGEVLAARRPGTRDAV